MCSAIVLSKASANYRALAKKYYNLTEEQLAVVDIHHNPPRCEGGRNIPEHLYIYHPITHKLIHDKQARNWAKKSGGNKTGARGKPPTKTQPNDKDIAVYRRRAEGVNRKNLMVEFGMKEYQVKRCLAECVRFGYPPIKGRGEGGYENLHQARTEETKAKIKAARAQQAPASAENLRKRSDSMKSACAKSTWSRAAGARREA